MSIQSLRPLIIITLLSIASFIVKGQNEEKRKVETRKVYVCMEIDRDTFQTAEEGCRHWAEKHLPSGYSFNEGSEEVNEGGAVKCICSKSGASNNEQRGKIMLKNICPENASESPGGSVQDKNCLCYQGYVADNSKKHCIKEPRKDKPTQKKKN